MNKKAISAIISAVMMILIGIVAVTMISVYIYDATNSLQLSPEVSCLELKSTQSFTIEKACYSQDSKEIEILIKRSFNSPDLESLNIISTSINETEKWEIQGNCKHCKLPDKGNSEWYYISSNFIEDKTLSLYSSGCVLDSKKINIC